MACFLRRTLPHQRRFTWAWCLAAHRSLRRCFKCHAPHVVTPLSTKWTLASATYLASFPVLFTICKYIAQSQFYHLTFQTGCRRLRKCDRNEYDGLPVQPFKSKSENNWDYLFASTVPTAIVCLSKKKTRFVVWHCNNFSID